jgi:predicted nucleic acid-binding protein
MASRVVFIDTAYLVAIADRRDFKHAQALRLATELDTSRADLVTTDAILIELGDYFSTSHLRLTASDAVAAIRADPAWEVVLLSAALVAAGEARFRRYGDKNWSVTDCISMEVMRQRRVREVATSDHGFEQAGFRVLMG